MALKSGLAEREVLVVIGSGTKLLADPFLQNGEIICLHYDPIKKSCNFVRLLKINSSVK